MTLVEFLALLVVAGICGSIGQALAGASPRGCLVTIVLGFIGALLGRWLSALLELPDYFVIDLGGRPFPVLWSIIGSAVFVAVLSLLTRQRSR